MGNRYTAKVTFPARAKSVPDIAKYLASDYAYEVDWEDEYFICLYDHEANYGEMKLITDLLFAAKIPYDHFQEGDGGDCDRGTDFVRFKTGTDAVAAVLSGEPQVSSIWISHSDEAVRLEHKRLMKILNSGDLDGLRRALHVEEIEPLS